MMKALRNISLSLVGLFLMGCPQPEPNPIPPLPTLSGYTSPNIGILKGVYGGTFEKGTANMTVSHFRMSQNEITRAQFLAIMGADPSDTFYSSGVNDPVQNVNWFHAIAFCNKLSLEEGLDPVYTVLVGGVTPVDWDALVYGSIPTTDNADWKMATADWNANGYRLPTEAEWEYAARGGNATHGYIYAGSNTPGDVAVFGRFTAETGRTTESKSKPVGSKDANELGLYDMSGNVSEWCWDWSSSYPTTDQVDYHGPDLGIYGTSRVMRGGSWDTPTVSCSVAARSSYQLHLRDYPAGFRVVRN